MGSINGFSPLGNISNISHAESSSAPIAATPTPSWEKIQSPGTFPTGASQTNELKKTIAEMDLDKVPIGGFDCDATRHILASI